MLQTYRAVIKGNQIQWSDEAPAQPAGGELHVQVTLDETARQPSPEAKREMLDAFERLAQRGTFADVDPVAWQREQRKDRPLPGRD